MNRNALLAALATVGIIGGVTVAATASAPDRPVPLLAAGASAEGDPTTTTTSARGSDDPTTATTSLAPGDPTTTSTTVVGDDGSTTTTTEVHHEGSTTTTTEVQHDGSTTSTTEVHHESTTTSTTEPAHGTMEIACGVPEHEFGIVCEWNDAPEGANHLVLLRRTRETDLEPIWRTDDVSTHRHVDGTVEPGGGYGYRIDAYDDDTLVASSNTATQMAPRPAAAGPLHIACATPANDGGPASVVCEWNDPPAGATRWVLMRELTGPSQPIWDTDDMSTRRHVDDTAEMGTTYSYRISAFNGDEYLGTSNPVRITAGGEG